MTLNFLFENLLFFVIATLFLIVVGWAWRNAKPYKLPQPLPAWFTVWFLTVQIGGVLLPLVALVWSIWQGYINAASVLAWYLLMLVLQILCESLSLRLFHSVVFVMVPYLYLPYRIWQLYEGLTILTSANELVLIRNLLVFLIVLWIANYALALSQLPRLVGWEIEDHQSSN